MKGASIDPLEDDGDLEYMGRAGEVCQHARGTNAVLFRPLMFARQTHSVPDVPVEK